MRSVLQMCLAILLAPFVSAGESKGQSVATHFSVPVKRPILCTVNAKLEGVTTVGTGAAAQKIPTTIQDEFVVVDEYLAFGKEAEKATRYIVKAFAMRDDRIADPPINGLDCIYERTGGNLRLAFKDDRLLPDPVIEQQIRCFRSLGVWLSFPKEAVPGTTYDFDFSDLAPFFTTNEVGLSGALARLRFESYDADSGIGVFKGPVAIVEKGTVEGRELSVSYTMDGTLRVNPGARQILSVSLAGKITLEEKRGGVSVTFTGTCAFELTTEIGAAATKARKQKPTFRDRVHPIADAGVKITLPSHYGEVKQEGGGKRFARGIEGGKGEAYVIVQFAPGDSSKPAAYYDTVTAELKKTDKNVKTEKVKSPLGAGRAYLFATANGEKKMRVRGEFYPAPKGFVLFKLLAEEKAFSAAEADFVKARKSLVALDAKAQPKKAAPPGK